MTDKTIKVYTNLPAFVSELIDVAKLFIVGCDFEYCDNIVDSSIIHIFSSPKKGVLTNKCQYKGSVYQNETKVKAGTNGLELKRIMKRFAKLSVYFCMKKLYKKQPPWGALTGIRPTKLAWELKNKQEDYSQIFKDTYDVSEKKISIVNNILLTQEGCRETSENAVDFYVGIPFCTSRCSYCSFSAGEISKLKSFVDPYCKALLKEIDATIKISRENNYSIRNIYFGGGTPTALPLDMLETFLSCFNGINAKEFTVEAGRPDTISKKTFDLFKKYNVGRISINPQTFNQRILDFVGRKHTVEQIVETYVLAKSYDFVVNMDFIAGLPTQTLAEFKSDINKVVELSPENVTVHTLALKKGSILKENTLCAENDGEVAKMVDYAYKKMIENDYQPYYLYRQKYMADNLENIGFCKEGKQSLYNIDIMEETTNILANGSNSISKRVFSNQNRIERVAAPKDLNTYINNVDKIIEEKRLLFENKGIS